MGCYPIGQGRTALGFSSVSRATGYSVVHTDRVDYGEHGGSDEIVWSSRIPDEKRLPTFWRVLSSCCWLDSLDFEVLFSRSSEVRSVRLGSRKECVLGDTIAPSEHCRWRQVAVFYFVTPSCPGGGGCQWPCKLYNRRVRKGGGTYRWSVLSGASSGCCGWCWSGVVCKHG